jgi:REP element-mobilizing transposase RayT
MQPNEAGRMIQTAWEALPGKFPNIAMDEFVVMPNHFHGILVINEHPGTEKDGVPRRAIPQLGDMIGAFKSITTYQYIQGVNCKGWPGFNGQVWQRNYWEHIIRNEAALEEIREYIRNNPARWEEDQLHPDAPPNRFKVWGRPGRQG